MVVTPAFGAGDRGSNPCPAAEILMARPWSLEKPVKVGYFVVLGLD